MISRQILLTSRPIGIPNPTDFETVETTLSPCGQGEILIKNLYISLDPAMRGWMDDKPSYLPPVPLGGVMRATTIGHVIESKATQFQVGDYVTGHFGVQTYAIAQADKARKVDARLAPLDVQIGLFSTSGLTAYFGLHDIGKPKAGETVLISGAAGAVGSTVGQLAKAAGCYVVGIVGSPNKAKFLTDQLGFDRAVNYRDDHWRHQLKSDCPAGIDIYFDNVGNPYLDEALSWANLRARFVLCGAIGQYNSISTVDAPKKYISLITRRGRMEGFIVFDYADRYDEAIQQLASMYHANSLKSFTHEMQGIDRFYDALIAMFAGANLGKTLLKLT